MAAEGTGESWRAVGVRGLTGAELDPLEALCAKHMEALQHSGTFVVLVVFLVADRTFNIHGLLRGGARAQCCSSWVPLLGRLDNIPCHSGREGLGSSVMVRTNLWMNIYQVLKSVKRK